MTKYIVHGGKPLFGEVEISGAKNAAVAIIPAAILVDGVCRIENIPQISDVTAILKILEQLGASIRSINRHTVEIDSRHIHTTRTSYELSRKLRASYYLIGALLGRFGRAEVAMPGGCNFGGVRPIDQHVKGFSALGAGVTTEGGYINATVESGRLTGANIYLDVVSVGATMNIMMAAVLAQGDTVIENCRQGTSHRGSGQLPELHGRRHPGRRYGYHQDPGRGAAVRRLLCHHSRPDRGRHLHGCRGRHRRSDPGEKHHSQAHGLHHRQAAGVRRRGGGTGGHPAGTPHRPAEKGQRQNPALSRLPYGYAAPDDHGPLPGSRAPVW